LLNRFISPVLILQSRPSMKISPFCRAANFFRKTIALIPLLAASITAAAGLPGKDVQLTDSGNAVILDNGIIAAKISKGGASVSSLRYKGFEMANTVYYSMDGGANYTTPRNCEYSVKTKTPDMVDIGMKSVWNNSRAQAVDIEVHYVLHRGDSGLYTYAILDHPANYPATGIGEWRMVWKLSNDLLEKIYVDDLRHWQMPSGEDYKHSEPTGIKEITKLTTGVRAGKYDCKYDFSVEYRKVSCWGHASDKNKVGGFIVLGSCEFFNDGPTKQDLNAASGINHIHFGMNHYNGTPIKVAAGEAWKKIYGPFLLYCNSNSAGADACWADAKARVEKEKAAWPYAWLTGNDAYPPANARGTVAGKFSVKDALKPALTGANAWIGLAQPEAGGNWQFETMHYQFWVKTDAAGAFKIPNIRPGKYTLSAFVDGAVGEFSKADVSVSAGQTVALGDLVWNVPHKGTKLAWEIGVPDRTAKEFRHGTDYFRGYVWQDFPKELKNPLEYTVGKSNPAVDWNFAQCRYMVGDKPEAWKWRVHFNLTSKPALGNATLTLAIASAQRASINVYVNNEAQPLAKVTPAVQGGNALLRESIHAKYCVEYVSFPVSKLVTGANTVTLEFPASNSADAHVMYDSVSLELP
jgi:rhamnogalacturonan endolyase